jgi:hypothetical protein
VEIGGALLVTVEAVDLALPAILLRHGLYVDLNRDAIPVVLHVDHGAATHGAAVAVATKRFLGAMLVHHMVTGQGDHRRLAVVHVLKAEVALGVHAGPSGAHVGGPGCFHEAGTARVAVEDLPLLAHAANATLLAVNHILRTPNLASITVTSAELGGTLSVGTCLAGRLSGLAF